MDNKQDLNFKRFIREIKNFKIFLFLGQYVFLNLKNMSEKDLNNYIKSIKYQHKEVNKNG